MRIFKDLPYNHIEDKFYNQNSPLGLLIDNLKASMVDENKFLALIAQLTYWEYPKISLWAFEEILNYIDLMMQRFKNDDPNIIIILRFLMVLLNNSIHKEIFSSFDILQLIFKDTFSIEVKNSVVDIFLIFSENKKSLMDNYVAFVDSCNFLIPLRPALIEYILSIKGTDLQLGLGNDDHTMKSTQVNENFSTNKSVKFDYFISELEKLLVQILKEKCNTNSSGSTDKLIIDIDNLKSKFRQITLSNENSYSILKEIKNILEQSIEDSIIQQTILNIFIFSANLEGTLYKNISINGSNCENADAMFMNLSKFTLNTLNLVVAVSQKKNKIPLISEYYIERYLKDVLEVITSKFSLELKSIFLIATIGFVSYFDGYESMLFQNGLFHSILSDMTSSKFDSSEIELELLTYKESIDQDFFNSVLLFLHKTSSFKEIPVHFLNKVLELPRNNIYPYRIDNVIFSLKKKRTLDESTLNDLVIPRLIYELNNFWVEEDKLKYLSNSKLINKCPSIFERSNLIQKLFKILYSIFEHNTNSSSLRYYESKMIDAVDLYIKTMVGKFKEMKVNEFGFYEPLLVSCIDFITKICYYLPSKIPSLIEMSSINKIFEYLEFRIPSQSNIINLIFYLIATLSKNELGVKCLTDNDKAIKTLDKMFETILSKDDHFFSNAFTPNGFITDEFYNPYTYFLRIENMNFLITHFFKKIEETIEHLKSKVNSIMLNENNSIKRDEILCKGKYVNIHSLRFSHILHLLGQFFMNITQDEKEYLVRENLVDLQNVVIKFYDLIFHPLNLFSLNSTVISSTMVKGVFLNNPERLLNYLLGLIDTNMSLLNLNNKGDAMLIDLEKENFNSENISKIFEEEHLHRILAKLVHLVEFTIKKLFPLVKDKSIIQSFISRMSILMLNLVKKQSNINVYLSPVNDCILVINQKNHYKFLSSKLNENLRQLLIENTKNKFIINELEIPSAENSAKKVIKNSTENSMLPKITIFNEHECLDVKFKQNLEVNMRVEILDGNNPYTIEMIDSSSKIIINSHMPILDFFITVGKTLKKLDKNLKKDDLEIIKCWNSLSFTVIYILETLDLKSVYEYTNNYLNNKQDLNKIVDSFIYFINIFNNINIVISDKTISPFVVVQFIKFGGYDKIFEICEFLLKFSEMISNKDSNFPLILLLLIKNLWNIITSIIMRTLKLNFENMSNINLILLKDNLYSSFELTSMIKYIILSSIYDKFLKFDQGENLGNRISMKRISELSFSFHSLIFSILDSCLIQYKLILDNKEDKDRKLVEEVVNMGFDKIEIFGAIQEGMKTADDVLNYILHSKSEGEEGENQENQEIQENENNQIGQNIQINQNSQNIQNDQNNQNAPFFDVEMNDKISTAKLKSERNTNSYKFLEHSLIQPTFDDESFRDIKSQFENYFGFVFTIKNKFSSINIYDNYSNILSTTFKILLEDQIYSNKISQIRKMNILFRIRDSLNQKSLFNTKILVPFLREIFIIERENFIDVSSNKLTSEGIKKLLQNRMFINYIIIKDRSRANNIFENLEIDEVASFFNEFDVIENSFISIKFMLISLSEMDCNCFDENFISSIRNLIYESLFIIHLGFHFMSYYVRSKIENGEEKNIELDLYKYDVKKFRKDYYNLFNEILELQLKFNVNENFISILDEQNLIIIFSTIVENFEYDENLQEFIDKGGLKKILKLRKNPNTLSESFNDAKFKFKVVFDEAFRLFLFKIFEDQKLQESLLESVIKYILANYYNLKSESTYSGAYKKKNKNKEDDRNLFDQANDLQLRNESHEGEDGILLNSSKPNLTNYKSNIETADGERLNSSAHNYLIEVNLDEFLAVTYPIIPKNKEAFLKVLKKICIVDKKIEKQIKNFTRKRKSQPSTETIILTLKLLPEYNNQVIQIANEMKNITPKEKDIVISTTKDEAVKDINNYSNLNSNILFKNDSQSLSQNVKNMNINSNNNNNNTTSTPSKQKIIPIQNSNLPSTKEINRKIIENQISKINKLMCINKINIINSIIKHIWTLTTDIEKEIDKNIPLNSDTSSTTNSTFNITQKLIIDLDTCLIAFANLINCFPSILSILLKYHQKNSNIQNTGKKPQTNPSNPKNDTTSFLTFMLKKIFYVLQFNKNCSANNQNKKEINSEQIYKEKDETQKCLGFEPNSQQSGLEACRNHSIISYFMQSICYRRRNMDSVDNYLINKSRKKVLKEIDKIIKEIKNQESIENSFSMKNIILYKIVLFSLFSITEFHDNSHVYSQLNAFEISKIIVSSSNQEILKNIIEIMKNLSLSSGINFAMHKLSTLFLSELLKFIRINPKINIKKTISSKDDFSNHKFLFKNLSSGDGDLILEANILDEDQIGEEAEENEEADVEMRMNPENVVDDIIEHNLNEEEDEDEEDDGEDSAEAEFIGDERRYNEEEEDEEEEEDGSESMNSNQSPGDFFYSISSSEDDDNSEEDEEEESEESEEEELSEDFENVGERNILNVNIENRNLFNDADEEEDFIDEFEVEDENYSGADEEDEEYIINENYDQNNHEISVQFNDEGNEYVNIEANDESRTESDYTHEEVPYRARTILYGNNLNSINVPYRLNNLTSILVNNNENANANEDLTEDILFSNPTYEKSGKAENNAYFEENVSFPFTVLLVNDELFEFYKPGIYISIINRLKRKNIENMNSVFQFRYASPFDKKLKRNLPFILNGIKEKVVSAFNKELTKMELEFLQNSSGELIRTYVSKIDSLDNMKDYICSNMGINLKELNKEIKETYNLEAKDMFKDYIKDSLLNSNKEDTSKNEEKKEEKTENENQQKNVTASFSEDLIDPEFLEHIPEELREDVLQNQKKLMEDKTIIDQYYNPQDIDPELLNEVNPDLVPGLNSNDNNIQEQVGSNLNQDININYANSDIATFLYSLPIEIREEVLLNSTPNFIRNLPQDLRQEAISLIEIHNSARILSNPIQIHSSLTDNIQISNHSPNFIQWGQSNKQEKKFVFRPPKYTFEEILALQKHQKEQTSLIINAIDEEFIEHLIAFNIKFTCESSPKGKISLNQYWILINTLVQNTNLRYKILDVLIIIWILDSICLKKILRENSDLLKKLSDKNIQSNNHENKLPSLLKYLYELYVDNKILEEFFYDDYDQFLKNFCTNYPKEMKKFFLETNYTDKGEYVSTSGKKYSISKSILAIKDMLNINFEKEENVLSNLIRIMLINSKSDIKKIFALKIFTNVVTNCLNSNINLIEIEKDNKNLKISPKTIEMIVDLFYNFETILEISKDRKSNNPTLLLSEMIADHKCFKLLLSVLMNHIEKLNEGVSFEMDHFFTQKKININEYSKPLPENVLFKIIKLVNQVNVVINKRAEKDEDKRKSEEEEQEAMIIHNENQMIVDSTNKSKSLLKSDQIKLELNDFIKQINSVLIKCWEKLDMLLFDVSKIMKEDQKIIDPKLNRLIPYLEAFITLSHLQFLPENKSQIKSNPFIMEAAYKKTPRKTPQKSHFTSSDFKDQLYLDFNEFFFRFCDKNRKIINLILRRYPKMFPPELLIKISHILDLEHKKKYFKYELRKLKTGKDYYINLRVRRDHIFTDSYTQLKHKKADEMRGKLTITFVGEEMAIDAGGVKREWFTQLSREMFNPNFMLFKLSANGSTYMPNSESGMFESDHLEIFKFIGRVIAKAIYDGFMLDCYFTRGFYKLLCNTPLTYHDMEDYDELFYKNLKWLLETDISDMDELYTFSYEEDRFGKLEVVDLIPDGRNIAVNEQNKFEYVQKLCHARLFENIKPQVEALQKGFYEIIPLKLITIFDHRELELVISGLPTIDVSDLKNNTIYENFNTEVQIIKWFWEILESYDNDERAEFIQFVTGSSKVPLEGFSALQGIGGINKFKISKVFDRNFDRLPTAHTCTNQLDLPEYPSKEIFYQRLNLAIREGKVGFGFV